MQKRAIYDIIAIYKRRKVFNMTKTEDQVRNEADKILGFNKVEPGIQQGTGQITTFNQLGFANHDILHVYTDTSDRIYMRLHIMAINIFQSYDHLDYIFE